MEVAILAVTKIIKVKVNEKACIKYITNDEKTDNGILVTYSGCQKDTAAYNFKLALSMNKRQTKDSNSVKAYHLIQSFAKSDKLLPDEAHKIGLEMMKRLFGEKYAFVCATHIDKGHLHNHFVVCAAQRDMTGRKLDDNLTLLHKLQKTNDELCREYGLDVIDRKKGKVKSYKEWLSDMQNPTGSKKQQLRDLINSQIKYASDFENFIERLKAIGVKISFGNSKKYGKVTKYKLPNSTENDKWNRGYSLGAGYSDEMIAKRIANRIKRQEERANMSKTDKAIDRTKIKIKSMLDTSSEDLSSSNIGLNKWKNRQNAMLAEQIKSELREKYHIDYTNIKSKIKELSADNNNNLAIVAKYQKSMEQLRTLIENCRIYSDTFQFNKRYLKSSNQERYYQEHEQELNAFALAEDFISRTKINKNILHDKEKAAEYISILQQRLESTEETANILMEQISENKKAIAELKKYQKELDVYHHRNNNEI